jgi:hypothetical protein
VLSHDNRPRHDNHSGDHHNGGADINDNPSLDDDHRRWVQQFIDDILAYDAAHHGGADPDQLPALPASYDHDARPDGNHPSADHHDL